MRAPDLGPFHTIETPNGPAHLRIDDVLALLPSGIGQCTMIMRGGGAITIAAATKDVAAGLCGAPPEAPRVTLVR